MSVKKHGIAVFFYILTAAAVLLAAHLGSKAVTVLSESAPIPRSCRIVIDAGHGGIDGGATSCSGKRESTYNLEIALRLEDLMHLLGHDTKMIRTTDVSVYTKGETIAQQKASDLKERVRIVHEAENSLLISIHQNHFSDSKYHGAQVFYADTEGSQQLAKQLQEQFVSTLNPGSNRKSKKSNGIYLMEHIRCTGILVECGFLSNPEEEAKLRSPAYQKQLCCVIASTISQFLSNT